MRQNLFLPAVVLAGAWTAMVCGLAQAQQRQAATEHAISVPATERLLEIRASMPGEVKAGESFQYQVQVSNVSQNTMLRDVKIEQTQAEGLAIDAATIQDRQGKEQSQRGGSWTIDELGPGQSRTIQVTATSQKEGQLKTCLAVTSYNPAVCLTTTSVKPELELVKKAPEQSGLCEPLEWEYFVKNTGTGDPGTFTIQDKLPQGIQTSTGEKELAFEVDGLEAGEVRKFVAKLQATDPGDYRSAAVAVRGEGKKTRSNEAGTRIIAADMAVAIDGPQTRYVNRLADYTVRVTNHGEAAAQNATLTVHYPGEVQMVNATQPRSSSREVAQRKGSRQDSASSKAQGQGKQGGQAQQDDASQEGRQGQQGQRSESSQTQRGQNEAREPIQEDQPTQAMPQEGQQNQDQQNQGQQSQGEQDQAQTFDPSETRSWNLGTLEPGQTMEVGFTIRGQREGILQFRAVADYACGLEDQKEDTLARDMAQTRLIALPALAVAVVDNRDPVPVDGEVQYTVVVANEGEANDSDLRISVKLPEELKFVSASGATDVKSEGQTLQFQPVDTIRPGQKLRWDVTAKAQQAGDINLQVEMQSQHLARTTTTEEPTVLFSDGAEGAQSQRPSQPVR